MDTRYKDDTCINEWFRGSEFHHLHLDSSPKLGIYIPKELHRCIRHNGKNGNRLNEINKEALIWLSNQSIINSENNNTKICKREIKKSGPDQIKLQRFSRRNVDRIITLEPMHIGDSFDDVLTRLLDDYEKLKSME